MHTTWMLSAWSIKNIPRLQTKQVVQSPFIHQIRNRCWSCGWAQNDTHPDTLLWLCTQSLCWFSYFMLLWKNKAVSVICLKLLLTVFMTFQHPWLVNITIILTELLNHGQALPSSFLPVCSTCLFICTHNPLRDGCCGRADFPTDKLSKPHKIGEQMLRSSSKILVLGIVQVIVSLGVTGRMSTLIAWRKLRKVRSGWYSVEKISKQLGGSDSDLNCGHSADSVFKCFLPQDLLISDWATPPDKSILTTK